MSSSSNLPMRPDLKLASVIRLALAYAVATNTLVLTPFIVSAFMQRFHIGEDVATQLAGVEILGIALSCALLPRWIARAAGRFAALGICGAILGQVASVLLAFVPLIGVVRGLTGVFEGMLFVVVASCVSQRQSADRLWGQINLCAGLINGGLLVMISYFPQGWLAQWLFVLLAGVAVLLAPAITGIGRHAPQANAQGVPSARRAVPLKLILSMWGATALVYGVQASQWAVAGLVGEAAKLSPSVIGVLLSLSSLLGFGGAVIPSLRGSHKHRQKIVLLALLALMVSIVWFFRVSGPRDYFLSQLLLNTSFFVIVPFFTGRLSEADPDGSLVARTVVVTFMGAGAGTAVAGGLCDAYGGLAFSGGLVLVLMLAIPFVCTALADHAKPLTGGRAGTVPG